MARKKRDYRVFLKVQADKIYWSRTGRPECRMTESEASISFAQEALGKAPLRQLPRSFFFMCPQPVSAHGPRPVGRLHIIAEAWLCLV